MTKSPGSILFKRARCKSHKNPLLQLCQLLAEMQGLLLVICGHDGDVEEEIWARQLGVWLYVPGLSNASSEDLALLCQQAYETADAAAR